MLLQNTSQLTTLETIENLLKRIANMKEICLNSSLFLIRTAILTNKESA